MESEIERGTWRDTGDAERMTLGAALDRYAQEVTPKHRGKEAELAHINVLRGEPLMRSVLAKVKRGNMCALRDRWCDHLEIATVNRRLTILHAVYEMARESWGMPGLENPVAGLKLKGENRRERRVSDREIAAIIDATESSTLGVFIRFGVETAIRRSETAKLEWEMLDLKTNVARLPGRITKNGRARDVPLSDAAVKCLRAVAKARGKKEQQGKKQKDKELGKGRIFALRPHSVTQAMMRAVDRARAKYLEHCKERGVAADPGFLVNLNYHDLRHEATSRLAEIFELHELMKITGHSDAKMLARYYHPRAEDFARRMREARGTRSVVKNTRKVSVTR